MKWPTSSRRRWRSWSGMTVTGPARRCRPKTLTELVAVVRDAAQLIPPARVHAVGSGWSFAAPAATDGVLVETSRLNRSVFDILGHPQCFGATAATPVDDKADYFHVESGVTLRDLSRLLDRGADHGGRLTGPRRALATLPAVGGQTLAGALSTGSHGFDTRHPPLADLVCAIHLVGPGGRQFWIEPTVGLICSRVLDRAYPGITVRRDDELFRAVLVSLGRFGIIYSVMVRVVPQFGLQEIRTVTDWSGVAQQLRTGGLLDDHRSVQIVLGPNGNCEAARPCYLTVRDDRPVAEVKRRRQVDQRLTRAIAASGRLISGPMSTAISATVEVADQRSARGLTVPIVDWLLTKTQSAGASSGVGYVLMEGLWWPHVLSRGDSIEVFLDATGDAYLDLISKHLLPLIERHSRRNRGIFGWVAIRFTGATSALLGMQRWPRTVAVEVAVLRGDRGGPSLLLELERFGVEHGTVHWGQHNTATESDVRRMFPLLPTWLHQLATFDSAHGIGMFDNDFCRAHGLTVPGPDRRSGL